MSTAFRQRVRANQAPLFGVWCALDSPITAEAVAHTDPDWILLDGEHGLLDASRCAPLLAAASVRGAPVLVRVPNHEPSLIARVLDAGAAGIMAPRVDDLETLRRFLAAALYPPAGARGIGPHRATRYYQDHDYLGRANDELVLIAQVESRKALDNLKALVAEPRLDVVFVGPNDLAASLGHFNDLDHPEVTDAIRHIAATARAAGKTAGFYCRSAEDALRRVEQGFRFVNVTADLGALVRAVSSQLRAARQGGK